MINNEKYNYDKLIEELTGCLNLKQFLMKKSFISKNLEDRVDEDVINNLFNQNIQIEMLEERELYLITEVFYRMLLNEDFLSKLNEQQQQLQIDLKPSLYFTEDEIRNYKNSVLVKEEKEDFKTIKFKNVQFMKEGVYSGVVDFNYILDLREKGVLFYNIDCQRETQKIKWRGTYIERPKVFPKSIHEISESMANNDYIPTDIAINVPSNGYEQFHVIEKPEGGLYDIIIKIDKNTALNLIDGNHRTTGGSLARGICRRQGKEFILNMGVKIMNLDPYWSRHYIFQESKKNPLDETLTKAMEMTMENKIAYYMNKGNSSDNPLSNRLGRELKDVKYLGKLTTIYNFAEGLKYFNIDPHDAIQEDLVKDFLKQYFKYVLSFHKEKLKDIKASREEGYEVNMNMFGGYLYIASKLINDVDWKKKLIKILGEIDYRIGGILEDIHLYKDEMSKTNIKKLENYIDSLLGSEEEEKCQIK